MPARTVVFDSIRKHDGKGMNTLRSILSQPKKHSMLSLSYFLRIYFLNLEEIVE